MFKQLVLAAIAVFVFVAGAQATDITFRGEVSYDEHTVLPPGSELWVSLVSLPSRSVVASAAAPVSSPARPPLAYTLLVRSRTIEQGGSFALEAQIRSGYRVLFRSPRPVPVDAAAPVPTPLDVVYAPAPLAPPAPAAEVTPALLDTLWTVTSIGGTPVLAETKVTFAIAADNRAGGHGGCNSYFTEASFGDQPLSFGPVAGTKMACADDVMAQEGQLFAALAATSDYRQSGNTLQLLDSAGIPLIGLVSTP